LICDHAWQVVLLEQEVGALLAEIRPDAVPLVDAFDFDDVLELHDSALGTKDGQVYVNSTAQ
jgi:hypothetical protein